jgi:WD40 repeat protein
MNFMPMAKTADGRTMVFVRSASIFVWHAGAPDTAVKVVPPPRSGVEPVHSAINSPTRATTSNADASAIPFRAVQISPRGDRIYLIDQGGQLHAWALDGASEVEPSSSQARDLEWTVPVAEGGFVNLALRSDGAVLALGDRTQTVTLVNTSNRRILDRIKPPSGEGQSGLLALAFSRDGHELAVGSEQGTISLWSIAPPAPPRLRFRLPGHRGVTTSLAFDAKGRQLASAGIAEALVEVWDLELIQRELARLQLAD